MIKAYYEPSDDAPFGIYRLQIAEQPEIFLSPLQFEALCRVIERLRRGELVVIERVK